MLHVRESRPLSQGVSIGKRTRGTSHGLGAPLETVSPLYCHNVNSLVVAAIRTQGSIITGVIANKVVEIMIDLGSSISLVRGSLTSYHKLNAAPRDLQLLSAAGESIPILGQITLPIQLGGLKVNHLFVVVQSLITPVILGIDFMHKHGLVLDFTTTPITVRNHTMSVDCQPDLKRLLKMEVAAVPSTFQSTDETVDDCAVPIFDSTTAAYDLPKCNDPNLLALLETYKQLFNASPGRTTITEHFIPTTGNPIKVPPRRVPVNYHLKYSNK